MSKFRLMRSSLRALLLSGVAAVWPLAGCKPPPQPPPAPEVKRYPDIPQEANLPDFMRGTVLEKAVLMNITPFAISGYGLVVDLRGTAENTVPSAVRSYMINLMAKKGFGMRMAGMENVTPEKVLRDPRVAIVRVDGLMPPGIRKGDRFDVQVSVPRDAGTTSLSHGRLWETKLLINGANELRPSGSVNPLATSEGPVFVNPAYAVGSSESATDTGADERGQSRAKTSLRYGVVMGGGRAYVDRPLLIRVRQAQFSMSRAIETRINHRFQQIADRMRPNGTAGMAMAQDEGLTQIWVPRYYRGDWQHYANVVMHLYLNNTPEFAPGKARELAAEALKPDAPLLDISYCWEGLGEKALPAFTHLINHEKAEISFAAARAAAFLGDIGGQDTLRTIAGTDGHPFQLNAIQALGALPDAPVISQSLRQLLDSPQTLVRVEAYRILARQGDASIYSYEVKNGFYVDLVPSKGEPLVYASRRGTPRIAIFGERPAIQTPFTFAAMDNTFSITSQPRRKQVTMIYRGPDVPEMVNVQGTPDLADLVARLGGEGAAADESRLRFSYGDVVGLMQLLLKREDVIAGAGAKPVRAAFVLQEDYGPASPLEPRAVASPEDEAALLKGGQLPELMPDDSLPAPPTGNGQRGN